MRGARETGARQRYTYTAAARAHGTARCEVAHVHVVAAVHGEAEVAAMEHPVLVVAHGTHAHRPRLPRCQAAACAVEQRRPGQHGSEWASTGQHGSAWVSMGQHGSAWASMGQHGSACVSIRCRATAAWTAEPTNVRTVRNARNRETWFF